MNPELNLNYVILRLNDNGDLNVEDSDHKGMVWVDSEDIPKIIEFLQENFE